MTAALAAKATVLVAAANGCAPGLPASFCHHHAETSCVARNRFFCASWAVDNVDRYTGPFFKHLLIVAISVAVGFTIALGLALLSHRHRWLVPPLTGFTGVLYTVPSIAFFFLLLPITGFGTDTAVIALSAYTLQIIYRNILAGLANVPQEAKDAGRGMGMTERQLLWRVELPLAVPEIVAGLRIATVSTVAIATLAFFAGAGGLGDPLYKDITFKTNVIIAGGLAILMAIALDALLLMVQRLVTPWRRARAA
jgi:osmoprotectant transport system permease protein